jgi:sugar/nucleoside kinase (ribokinase family)
MQHLSAILCAGIAVQDLVFRVESSPAPGAKAQALDFIAISGGCAANAATAIARLGGNARFAGPLGGAGDAISDRILADLTRVGVDVSGAVRVAGTTSPISGIMIDARGERTIATHRDQRLASAQANHPAALVDDVAIVLADNRFPDFIQPICIAARTRGLPVVLDADKPTSEDDPLFASASHVIFSAECLRATTGLSDLGAALTRMRARASAFLAVTDGANDVRWMPGESIERLPVVAVQAVDTLAAGDVFHGAFALALAEGRAEGEALRFAAAAATLKCGRFGGITGAPARPEVERFLADHAG